MSTGVFGWLRAVLGAPARARRLARAEQLTLAGDLTGALAVIDGVLLGLPDTAQVAAAARFDRAELLAELGRPAEALAGYEQVLARCTPRESQSRAPSRQRLALVLSASFSRAILLADLGKRDAALTAYDATLEFTERWPVTGMAEVIDSVRVGRASLLADLGQLDEALAGYDDLTARYPLGTATDEWERAKAANALLAKAGLLDRIGRPDEALAAYADVADHHSRAPSTQSREQSRRALRATANLLDRLGRHAEAMIAHDRAERL